MVRFSSTDLFRLQQLLSLLSDPPDADDLSAWREEITDRLRCLLSADTVHIGVPSARWWLRESSGPRAGLAMPPASSFALSAPDPRAQREEEPASGCRTRAELHGRFRRPRRLPGGVVMQVNLPDGSPAFVAASREVPCESFESGCEATLSLLLPAFEAGMRAWWRRMHERVSLARFIDRLTVGAALFDPHGTRLLHVNPALLRILGGDPDAERVRCAVERVARAAGGTTASPEAPPADVIVGAYEIHANPIGAGVAVQDRAVVVTVESRRIALPPPREIGARFGLTQRESDVAALLARGLSDRQIATELVISWHTARRHTERVLRKLRVHSRAEVSARLLGV